MDGWTLEQVPQASARGQVAIVTGASSGLGLETARALALKGWDTVIMAVRNVQKAEGCLREISATLTAEQAASLKIMKVDVSSAQSIRDFCKEFKDKHTRLDLLVNNAGVMFVGGTTVDGCEMHMGTNVYGPFIMTALLLDVLVATKNARVVNVSSLASEFGLQRHLVDLASDMNGSILSYSRSKLCNLLFTFELAKRLHESGKNKNNLLIVSCHPGYTDTNLQYADKGAFARGAMWLSNSLFSQRVELGAVPTLRAATDPAAVSCNFYGPSRWRQMWGPAVLCPHVTRYATDAAIARDFFEQAQKNTGIDYTAILQAL